jgi:hypothetical protein
MPDDTVGETGCRTVKLVVWSDIQPEAVGTLINLDTYDLALPIELDKNVEITVRVSEQFSDYGY